MDTLEKLAIQQFKLSSEIKRLKSLSGEIIDKCQQSPIDGNDPLRRGDINHIQMVVRLHRDQKADSQYYEWESFEDILCAEVSCPHCLEWHRIQRKEILPLKRKLKSVRGAITKAGKRLSAA